MILKVKVFPNSSKACVVEGDGIVKVYVKESPERGQANKAVIKCLARHFNLDRDSIKIVKGLKERNKLIEISP
jgi:uncharacterized protein (TIGR00251 family)